MDGGKKYCNQQCCRKARKKQPSDQAQRPEPLPEPLPRSSPREKKSPACTTAGNSTQILFVEPNFVETPSEYETFYDCSSDNDLAVDTSGMSKVLKNLEDPEKFRGTLKKVVCTSHKLLKSFDEASKKKKPQPCILTMNDCVQKYTGQGTVGGLYNDGDCNAAPYGRRYEPITFTIPVTVQLQYPASSDMMATPLPSGMAAPPMEPIRTSIVAATRAPNMLLASDYLDPDSETGRKQPRSETDSNRHNENINKPPKGQTPSTCCLRSYPVSDTQAKRTPEEPCLDATLTSARTNKSNRAHNYPSNFRCKPESCAAKSTCAKSDKTTSPNCACKQPTIPNQPSSQSDIASVCTAGTVQRPDDEPSLAATQSSVSQTTKTDVSSKPSQSDSSGPLDTDTCSLPPRWQRSIPEPRPEKACHESPIADNQSNISSKSHESHTSTKCPCKQTAKTDQFESDESQVGTSTKCPCQQPQPLSRPLPYPGKAPSGRPTDDDQSSSPNSESNPSKILDKCPCKPTGGSKLTQPDVSQRIIPSQCPCKQSTQEVYESRTRQNPGIIISEPLDENYGTACKKCGRGLGNPSVSSLPPPPAPSKTTCSCRHERLEADQSKPTSQQGLLKTPCSYQHGQGSTNLYERSPETYQKNALNSSSCCGKTIPDQSERNEETSQQGMKSCCRVNSTPGHSERTETASQKDVSKSCSAKNNADYKEYNEGTSEKDGSKSCCRRGKDSPEEESSQKDVPKSCCRRGKGSPEVKTSQQDLSSSCRRRGKGSPDRSEPDEAISQQDVPKSCCRRGKESPERGEPDEETSQQDVPKSCCRRGKGSPEADTPQQDVSKSSCRRREKGSPDRSEPDEAISQRDVPKSCCRRGKGSPETETSQQDVSKSSCHRREKGSPDRSEPDEAISQQDVPKSCCRRGKESPERGDPNEATSQRDVPKSCCRRGIGSPEADTSQKDVPKSSCRRREKGSPDRSEPDEAISQQDVPKSCCRRGKESPERGDPNEASSQQNVPKSCCRRGKGSPDEEVSQQDVPKSSCRRRGKGSPDRGESDEATSQQETPNSCCSHVKSKQNEDTSKQDVPKSCCRRGNEGKSSCRRGDRNEIPEATSQKSGSKSCCRRGGDSRCKRKKKCTHPPNDDSSDTASQMLVFKSPSSCRSKSSCRRGKAGTDVSELSSEEDIRRSRRKCPCRRVQTTSAASDTSSQILPLKPQKCPCRRRQANSETYLPPRSVVDIPLIPMGLSYPSSSKEGICSRRADLTSLTPTPGTFATDTSRSTPPVCAPPRVAIKDYEIEDYEIEDYEIEEKYYSLSSSGNEEETCRDFCPALKVHSSAYKTPDTYQSRPDMEERKEAGERGRSRKKKNKPDRDARSRSESMSKNMVILQLLHQVVHLINEEGSMTDSSSALPQQKILKIGDCCEEMAERGVFSSRTNLSAIKISFMPKDSEQTESQPNSLALTYPLGGSRTCDVIISPLEQDQSPTFAHVAIGAQSFVNWNQLTERSTAPSEYTCSPGCSRAQEEASALPSSRPESEANGDGLEEFTMTAVEIRTEMAPSGYDTEGYEGEECCQVVSEYEVEKCDQSGKEKSECKCCYCRSKRDETCKTIATPEQALGKNDPCRELKYFVDSVIMDLEAMENARRDKCNEALFPKKNSVCGRQGFPVTIIDVTELGSSSLYIRWCIHDCFGIGGYEIYVDGFLTNRYFNSNHEAAVVCDVSVTEPHKVILLAQPRDKELSIDNICGLTKEKKSEKNRSLAMKSAKSSTPVWTPSVYYYDPVSSKAVPQSPMCAYVK